MKTSPVVIRDNAVIYARYSPGGGQREESIEGQVRECKDYARRMNLNIIGEYCDSHLTGTNDKRPEFQRLIRDSAKGQFSIILVWKLDRFARNRYDSAIYKAKLKKHGVRVISAMESIPEGPEGILLLSLMEGYAEYYSANLSQNVKRGMYESALKLQTLGYTVYGLRKGADGRFEIDPATAPVVRRIFEEYTAGKPAKEICNGLNRDGFRTATGGEWNKSSLPRILKNEKYCGVYQYADIRVEDGIPAIVSKEIYRKARDMVDQHHHRPAAKKIEGGYLLTGKLYCGHCGELMVSDAGTSVTGKVYNYYSCNGRRKKKCKKERVAKQWIEDTVVDALVRIANDDEVIDNIADRFMEWQESKGTREEVTILEKRLKKNEAAIQNVIVAIDNGMISDSLRSHLIELEAEKADIEKGIALQSIEDPIVPRVDIIRFLQSFRNGDKNDVSWRIYIVETFLQAVYLYDDGRLILTLNYGGNDNKITINTAKEAVERGTEISSNLDALSPPSDANLNYRMRVCFLAGVLAVEIRAVKKARPR